MVGGGGGWSLHNPVVVAEPELLPAHAAVPRHVEDHEDVRHLLGVQSGRETKYIKHLNLTYR